MTYPEYQALISSNIPMPIKTPMAIQIIENNMITSYMEIIP